jgi:hypothetical protein
MAAAARPKCSSPDVEDRALDFSRSLMSSYSSVYVHSFISNLIVIYLVYLYLWSIHDKCYDIAASMQSKAVQ